MTHAAYTSKEGSRFLIGNRFMERELTVRGRKIATSRLTNKLTGTVFRTGSSDFALKINSSTVLTPADFVVTGTATPRSASRGRQLVVKLANRKHGLSVELRYRILPDDFYMRKQVVVDGKENLINWVEVERLRMQDGTRFRYGGFGQPLFVSHQLFMGLEYPAGHNLLRGDKTISLRHYPGRKGRIMSRNAVIGVCPDTVNNRIKDWFLEYIDRHRARPIRKFFCEYPNSQKNRRTDITTWFFDEAHETFYKQGIRPDSIMIHTNQCWVEPQSVMKEMPEHKQLIPASLLKRKAKQKLGAETGFHLNAGGGRGSTDHAWLAEHFDMISSRYYCMADPRVKKELKKNLLHLTTKYDAVMFSFDWIWWKTALECPKDNHRGHIKGIRYSREAITDAYLEILEALRKANPDIVLQDIEAELSPWWLLWSEGLAGYTGEGPNLTHDYIASKHWAWFRKNTVFPMSDIWEPSYHPIEGGLGYITPQRKGEYGSREFLAAGIMPFIRGGFIIDVQWNLPKLTQKEKDAYVRVLKWGFPRHDVLLANTTFILGNPRKAQVYGYAHFKPDNRGIIGIFNPAHWRADKARIVLDERAHFHHGVQEPCIVKVVYPYLEVMPGTFNYGDSVTLDVQGGDLMILEVIPCSQVKEPLLAGCRYRILNSGSCRLLGLPGEEKTLRLLNPEDVTSVRIDGNKTQGQEWRFRFKGKPRETFAVKNLRSGKGARRGRDKKTHKLSFAITIPANEKVRLRFLTEVFLEEGSLTEVEGKELEKMVEDVVKKLGMSKTHKLGVADHRRSLTVDIFEAKAQGATRSSLRNNGRVIDIKQKEVPHKKLDYVGRHPHTESKVGQRTWGTSEALSSGRVSLDLSINFREAGVRVWLERETRLVSSPTVTVSPLKFNPEDSLPQPDEWSTGMRTIVNLVDEV